MLNETLGKWHFWLFLIGFHLTFDFMHIPGVLGMPRRIYTYEPGRGWEIWNLIISIGVIFQIAGSPVLGGEFRVVVFQGSLAGNDPWDAWTLEWATTSPPPDYNFAQHPGGAKPASAVGLEASGRSGLEVRIEENRAWQLTIYADTAIRNAACARMRGRVGMWCLIAAESAIFSIFVVAYLYYAGKSLSGPTPREVLHVPVFNSICLFASSFTIVMAERAIARGKVEDVRDLVVPDHCAGGDFHPGHRPRVVSTDLRRRPDHQLQSLWDHLLFTGRPARVSRHRWADRAVDHHDLHCARAREAGARGTYWSLRHVLAFCGRNLGGGSLGCVFHCTLRKRGTRNGSATRPTRTAIQRDDHPARADRVAVCHGARRLADFRRTADQRIASAFWARCSMSPEQWVGFARCFLMSTTIEVPVVPEAELCGGLRRRSHAVEGRRSMYKRAWLPLKIYPISAGVKGGLAGAVAMALLAMLYGADFLRQHLVSHKPAGRQFVRPPPHALRRADAALPLGLVSVRARACTLRLRLLVGLFYGAMLPMLPNRPILLGGVIAPLIWTGLLYHIIGFVNPLLDQRINWSGSLPRKSRSASLPDWWWCARTKCGPPRTCRLPCGPASKRRALMHERDDEDHKAMKDCRLIVSGLVAACCLRSPACSQLCGKPAARTRSASRRIPS